MRRLLIRPGAIGDFIVSLPAMESLARGFHRGLVRGTECSARPVCGSGAVDRIGRPGPAGDHSCRRRGGAAASFDDIVSWYGENRPDFRELVRIWACRSDSCGAAGWQLPCGGFLCAQARGLGANVAGNPPFACPDVPRTFAAIHPFASSKAKRAPMEFFDGGGETGAHDAGPLAVRTEEELPEPIRITDLYELACWLRGARIFVGNDSGISHLAAAVGTPVMAFFPASDPKVWAPRGCAVNVTLEMWRCADVN